MVCLSVVSALLLPVRGWMIHGTDRPYLFSVLSAARQYGINHLEIAGNNPTMSEEFLEHPDQTRLIEEAARRGKEQGLPVYVWIREFNAPKDIRVDASFWKARQEALRRTLRTMPSLAGVVMSYASTPLEIWDVTSGDPEWQAMSQPQRIRFTTERFRDVVVGEFHKRMYVRDFNHSPDELRWLVEGLRNETGIVMHSKAEPQDWQLFYPHSPSQGAYGSTPQIVEFDLTGEYWGQSLVPVPLVDYLIYRWRYDRSKGAIGMVGRIDRDDHRTLGSPNEINLFAQALMMQGDPITADEIYRRWNSQRYALKGKDSRHLTNVYRRCVQVAKRQYYTLGFWTPKNQTFLPDSMRNIESAIRGKSTAQWDHGAKATETALLNPDVATVDRILAEKAEAVRLAGENVHEFSALRPSMRPQDFAVFCDQLVFMKAQAELWEAMARAYWMTKLAAKGSADPSKAMQAIERFEVTATAIANPAEPRFAEGLRESAVRLSADLRNVLAN